MRQSSLFRISTILFSLVMAIILGSCVNQVVPRPVRTAVAEIQETFAPDKRVALFDVRVHAHQDTIFLSGETNLPEAHAALLAKLDRQEVNYIDGVKVLPEPGRPARGVVNVSVANIRSTPRHSGELATQALLGTGLKVYKQEGDWFYVQTPDDYLGWTDSGGFTLMDEETYRQWLRADKVIFTADYGFVLDSGDPEAGRVSDLVAGSILLDEGVFGVYQAVGFPDGRKGFVPRPQVLDQAAWLRSGDQELSYDRIIETARSYLGRPYLWGGTSGKGMDCSGFTKTVYLMHGLVLPRDASQQVHAGEAVPTDTSFSSLLPGDFLFFGTNARDGESEKIRHVGIYLGDGQFIHSGADNPGVMIQSLLPGEAGFAPHRRETFVRARRMAPGSSGVAPAASLQEYYGPATPLGK